MRFAHSTTITAISMIAALLMLGVPVQADAQAADAKAPQAPPETPPEKDKKGDAVQRDRILQIFQIQSADAEEIAELLVSFLKARPSLGDQSGRRATGVGRGGPEGMPGEVPSASRGDYGTQIIADWRTNKLIVETTAQQDLDDIKRLVKEFDVPVVQNRLKANVYQVKYSKADELASILQTLLGAPRTAGGPAVRPSYRRGVSTRSRTPTAPPATAQVVGASQNVGSGALIMPYSATNSILIQASPEDYKQILEILGEIDVKRRQVFTEVAIVRVGSGSGLNHAIEVLAGEPDAEGARSRSPSASDQKDPGSGVPEAFLTIVEKGDFPALVQLLKGSQDCQVLAHPFLLADENEQNQVDITETRYVQNTSTGASGVTTASVQGEDAGITLSMVPTISASQKAIRLELSLEISEFIETDAGPDVLPPKITSSVMSSVTVPDGKIFVIGGLTPTGRAEKKAVEKNDLYVLLRARVLTAHPAK